MYVKGEKKNERLEQIKQTVNKAVEIFVDAAKEAENKMAFKAFTLGGDMDLEAQYKLSDIILTQAAIHLKEYTPHSIDKYTYSCATSVEENGDEKNLVVWFNFSREKPEAPEDVQLTDEDIMPSFIKKDEDKTSVEVVADTLVEVSGVGHVDAEQHIIRGATYDA
jgi:O-methyltransferase involved in polyketide biosynthesis